MPPALGAGWIPVLACWLPIPVALFGLLINQPVRGVIFALCETAIIVSLPLIGIATYAGLSWWFPVGDRTGHTR